ncbi:hypothetical protein BB559_003810 [Furculomyces boomerangus]|uniref:SH3 domain-containing protein n=2 Tax=Harpellales TaxID=61421 RepID=A0A2T9YIM6_9FUNG|nr:hypothetical protein BB559_003810 [Furculomyces boomerangus]PWA03081.1 hypothetical protein BB558_000769 [Smittium angustum]
MDAKIEIYDFAYNSEDPRHKGIFPSHETNHDVEQESLQSSADTENADDDDLETKDPENKIIGKARALYDFAAESEYELGFSQGDILILTKKQGEGWVIGYKGDDVGLVPENYVELIP